MDWFDGCWNCKHNDFCWKQAYNDKCGNYEKCGLYNELDKLAHEMDNIELE